ncbi:MAG: glycosyltransferase family 39 protein [Thiotrichaceae bacterium]|nr:glycosyltransferase family 39 protein [Thiotrichaceae bacterium]
MKFLRSTPNFFWGVSGLLLLLGVFLRARQYFFNRSIWLDEAFIATNLERGWSNLLSLPLDYSHSHIAPPGFLVINKVFVSIFGQIDWAIRLFPFLASLAALWLFYKLASRVLSPMAVPIAILLFAISDALIFQAVNFKQYSSDVAITLLLSYWAILFVQKTALVRKDWIRLGILGAVVVWFSHPAIFVLVTIGLYLTLHFAHKKQFKTLLPLFAVGAVWVISFLVMYRFISGGGIATSSIGMWLIQFWIINQGFMPPVWTLHAYNWLLQHYIMMFSSPGGLGVPEVAGILFLIGGVSLYFTKRAALFILVFPLLLVIIASALYKYPFMERLLLFLLPMVYLLIAEALVQLKLQLSTLSHSQWIEIPTKILLMAALISSSVLDLPILRTVEEIKPLLSQLQQQRTPQDTLYIYHWAEPAFRFYAKQYGLDYNQCALISKPPVAEYTKEIDYFRSEHKVPLKTAAETHCILGVAENYDKSAADIEQLRGKGRVWILFTHANQVEISLFLNALNQMGKKQAEWLQPGASLHLYELK